MVLKFNQSAKLNINHSGKRLPFFNYRIVITEMHDMKLWKVIHTQLGTKTQHWEQVQDYFQYQKKLIGHTGWPAGTHTDMWINMVQNCLWSSSSSWCVWGDWTDHALWELATRTDSYTSTKAWGAMMWVCLPLREETKGKRKIRNCCIKKYFNLYLLYYRNFIPPFNRISAGSSNLASLKYHSIALF